VVAIVTLIGLSFTLVGVCAITTANAIKTKTPNNSSGLIKVFDFIMAYDKRHGSRVSYS
jgi:hypothetical protein